MTHDLQPAPRNGNREGAGTPSQPSPVVQQWAEQHGLLQPETPKKKNETSVDQDSADARIEELKQKEL